MDSQISRLIRSLLGEHNVTGAALARRLGLSQSYVSRRIRGAVPWRASDLELIAREFDIDPAALIPGERVS